MAISFTSLIKGWAQKQIDKFVSKAKLGVDITFEEPL
jgi:hypothetical protein